MNKIIDNVYLGDRDSAAEFDGYKLSVHEGHQTTTDLPDKTHWVPIMMYQPYLHANKRMLDAAAEIIQWHYEQDNSLYIHCEQGLERSPLTVAYWLDKFWHTDTIDEGYELIKESRPQVFDRSNWLDFP